jgi:hypothetical protein
MSCWEIYVPRALSWRRSLGGLEKVRWGNEVTIGENVPSVLV